MVQGGEIREENNVIHDVERDEEVDVKTRSESSMVAMAYALLVALLLAYAISLVVRRGDQQWTWLDGWMVCAFELAASVLCISRGIRNRPSRPVALSLGSALLMWSIGDVLLTAESIGRSTAPSVSVADVFYLLFYPLAYVACVLLFQRGTYRINKPNWLDGIVAGGGASALCAAFAFHSINHFTGGSTLSTTVNLAYPIGDFLLLLFVFGGSAVLSSNSTRQWFLMASGLIVIVVGDTFNVFQASGQMSRFGSDINSVAWPLAILLMSASVWAPRRFTNLLRPQHLQGFIITALATVAALGVLVSGTLNEVSHVAIGLAVGTLVVIGIRLTISARRLRMITEERHRQANTDELTGLGNRRQLAQVLDIFFDEQRADERRTREMAFLFVDLNSFKEVNDSFGHPAGDELLRQLGPRLAASLEGEGLAVRMGGDEFAVVLMDADANAAAKVAHQIVDEITKPFILHKITATVGASIGIALMPHDAKSAIDLMWCADVAMYRAKLGNAPFVFYDQKLDGEEDQVTLSESLRDAVNSGDLTLHYQPQLDMRNGQITAVEALIRWPHPTLGLIPPMKFLPLAEKAGLMWTLTTWVLNEALGQCAIWHRRGQHIAVSVNVATTELLQVGFLELVEELLTRYDVPADYLVIEITETTIISDFVRSQEVIRDLRRLGVLVSIDDFGAGFTSLAYLRSLDVGELKLDRTFISSLSTQENVRDFEIVRATINLGHEMGLRVVAEGIEDVTTLEILNDLGCDIAQGYYISRPTSADKISFQSHETPARVETLAGRH
jgi:diguanylate cyclase (GGDEF)-like protein